MEDESKTKEQLIEELAELRRQVAEYETNESKSQHDDIKQRVQSQIRARVWEMNSSDDIRQVQKVIYDGLTELGVPFNGSGINWVDTSTCPSRVRWRGIRQDSWVEGKGRELLLQCWQSQEVFYRKDLEKEDEYGEFPRLHTVDRPLRSVIDIPFLHGTLSVNSLEPNAFSEDHIRDLQELADVLSEGLQRMDDLHRLEQRNQDLEREITERKQAEEALRKLSRAVEQNPASIVITNREGEIEYVNPKFCTLTGYPVEEILGQNPRVLKSGEHPSEFYRELWETITAGKEWRGEFHNKKKGGELYWELASISPITNTAGAITHFVGIKEDITQRKQMEQELRESERKYRLLVERLPIGISHNTPDGKFLVYNPYAQNMTGYTLQELSAMKSGDLYVHPEDREDLLSNLQEKGEHTFEYPLRRKDGRVIMVRGTTQAIKDAEGRMVELQGYTEDITERKHMEQELIRLERLRAVGELSAGVSHNLNNILTNVLGPAQLLKRKSDDPEILREVDDIVTSAIRARDLVHELHLSVRTDEEESLTPVSVDQIVQQAVQTSRPRWKDEPEAQGISIKVLTRGESVPSIQGTEAGLHDILTNFIFNAVDAMPEGGTISIETQAVEDQVQITFSDTGTGMDEETKRRVFEPFYMTIG